MTSSEQLNAATDLPDTGVKPVPLTAVDTFRNRIDELCKALQANLPGYELLLQQIHTALTNDDEVVQLLSEEEIGVICAGLSKRKNVVIMTTEKGTKAKSTTGKSLKNITLDDI